MKDIDAADLAFVVHNGDFWWDGAAWTEKAGGLPPCSDARLSTTAWTRAQRSRAPLHLCRRATTNGPTATAPSRAPTTLSNGLGKTAPDVLPGR